MTGNLSDALRYPTRGEHAEGALLVGWILGLSAALLLRLGPGLFALSALLLVPAVGYLVRVLRTSMAGDPDPPRFGGWRRLVADGLVSIVVSVSYLLVPLTLLGVTAAGATGATGGGPLEPGRAVALLVASTVTFTTVLAFAYAFPVALANVAAAGTVRAAVRFGSIATVAGEVTYFVAWVQAVVVVATGWGLAGLLAVTSRFGTVVAAVFAFYAAVVACRLVGAAYGDATGAAAGTTAVR